MKNSRKRRWLLFALLLLLLGGVGFLIFQPTGPEFNGKSLRYWFSRFHSPRQGDDASRAAEAIRSLGTNALPYLVGEALSTATDSPLRVRFYALLEKLPGSWDLPRFVSCDALRSAAVSAIHQVSPPPEIVLPMVQAALDSENALRHHQALEVLCGPRGGRAKFAAIFGKALRVEDRDRRLNSRALALQELCDMGTNAMPALPDLVWLINRLPLTNNLVPVAAGGLAALGTNAAAAVPRLLEAFRSKKDWGMRCLLAVDVLRIDPQQAEAIEFLTRSLTDRRDFTSIGPGEALESAPELPERNFSARVVRTVEVLAQLGRNAPAAIPALTEAFNGTNQAGWCPTAWALHQIGAPRDLYLPRLQERLQASPAPLDFEIATTLLRIDPANAGAQSRLAAYLTNGSPKKRQTLIVLESYARPAGGEVMLALRDLAEKGDGYEARLAAEALRRFEYRQSESRK